MRGKKANSRLIRVKFRLPRKRCNLGHWDEPKMAVIFSNSFMSNLQLQERKYAILHDDALKEPLHILLCLSDKLHPNHPRQELLLLSSHLRYLFPKLSVAINFLTHEKIYLAKSYLSTFFFKEGLKMNCGSNG